MDSGGGIGVSTKVLVASSASRVTREERCAVRMRATGPQVVTDHGHLVRAQGAVYRSGTSWSRPTRASSRYQQ